METVKGKAGIIAPLALSIVVSFAAPANAGEGKSAMTVANGKRVSIEYTLTLEDHTKVDSNVGAEPLTYTQGSREILPALQEALLGLKEGDTKHVTLSPEDGYGPVDPAAFQTVEKNLIPENARHVGAQLLARDASGHTQRVRVHEVKDDTVVVDLNHPLAGKTLVFDVRVLKIAEGAD